MNPHHWRTIEDVFQAALDLPEADREGFVRKRCAHDKAASEVLALLAQHGAEGTFIDRSAAEDVLGADGQSPDPLIGRTIGRYRVLGRLGEGGMGSVYLAERADGAFEQRVALKLLRAAGGSVLRRFEREREVLARLEHPNIARLIDGGVTEDGRAFLAMEHVDGEPIDRHAVSRHLGVRERLGLMLQVCEAIAFTHQNLVIHRDLKPSNILVDGDGRVRVIDFGIALPAYLGDAATMHTSADQVLGTLAYMSPEQCERGAGAAVDVRSDVYAIGAVMYRLLTGTTPIDISDATLASAVSRIMTSSPARPSSFEPSLRGDLDTILLKALEKEPGRRYQSVGELAEDLRRHLESRPILATPPSVGYVTRKFLVRHRSQLVSAGVSAAAIVLFAVLAATWFIVLPGQSAQALHAARVKVLSPEMQAAMYNGSYWRLNEGSLVLPLLDHQMALDEVAPLYDRAVRFGAGGDGAKRERAVLAAARDLCLLNPREWAGVWPDTLGDGVRAIALGDDLAGAIQSASLDDLRDAGILLMLTNHANRAVRVLQHYETIVQSDPFIEGMLGELYLALEYPELAYPRIRAAYEEFGASRMMTLSLAEAAIGVGDLARARLLLDEAESLSDADSQGRSLRVRAMYLAASGREAEAHEAFMSAAAFRSVNGTSFSLNPIALYHRANFERDRNQWSTALRHAVWTFNMGGMRFPDIERVAARGMEQFVSLMEGALAHWMEVDRRGLYRMLASEEPRWLSQVNFAKNLTPVHNLEFFRLYGRARAELLKRPPKIAVLPGDAERFAAEREALSEPTPVTRLAALLDVENAELWDALPYADERLREELVQAWIDEDPEAIDAATSAIFASR